MTGDYGSDVFGLEVQGNMSRWGAGLNEAFVVGGGMTRNVGSPNTPGCGAGSKKAAVLLMQTLQNRLGDTLGGCACSVLLGGPEDSGLKGLPVVGT